jgi:hypothetical protein
MRHVIHSGLLGLVAVVLAACGLVDSARQTDTQPAPTTITLHYNGSSLVIRNVGDNLMADPSALDFVRGQPGSDGDDYNGGRLVSGALGVGQCYTLVRRGSEAVIVPSCVAVVNTEIMTDITNLFWKAEPIGAGEFDVRWQSEVITTCETYSIQDSGTKLCSFVYPPLSQPE